MSATAVARWFAWINGPDSRSAGDDANLRVWFAGFLSWLAVLTGVGVWWFARVEAGVTADLGVWLAAVGMFYLSLCCLFLPLPTAWVVLLLASNDVALTESVPVRVMVVAVLCAFATGVANLNEYHILTFMLRYRAVGRLRQTRLYQLAASWFCVAPFWTITAFSFIPVPVDVVRVLAIAARYSRMRFAGAYFVGRFFRYGLLALSAAGLRLTTWDIVIIQVVLVLVAGLKVVHSVFRRRRCRSLPGGEDAVLPG